MMDGISNGLGGPGSATVLRLDPAARGLRAAAASTSSAKPSDAAELSPLARAAHDAGTAPVDGARIEALRASIADGSYQIDHDAIATKMMALDLGWAKAE